MAPAQGWHAKSWSVPHFFFFSGRGRWSRVARRTLVTSQTASSIYFDSFPAPIGEMFPRCGQRKIIFSSKCDSDESFVIRNFHLEFRFPHNRRTVIFAARGSELMELLKQNSEERSSLNNVRGSLDIDSEKELTSIVEIFSAEGPRY